MRVYKGLFNSIIESNNLFLAWDEFRCGKEKKLDVLDFMKNLEQHIFKLHRDLRDMTYKHGPYSDFFIHDPKRRHIYKSTVRDRVLHHAVFKVLNPIFEPGFISTSCSCRVGKGNHEGVAIASKMLRKESRNNTRECYVLKCDIKKFFDTIDHEILLTILERKIKDPEVMQLLEEIIGSYETGSGITRERERELSLFSQKRNSYWKSDLSTLR